MQAILQILFLTFFFFISTSSFVLGSKMYNFPQISGYFATDSLFVDAGNDTTLTCLTQEVEIGRSVSQGASISYQWFEHEHGIIVGDTPKLTVFGPGTYTLTAFDKQTGQSVSDKITIFEDKIHPQIQLEGEKTLDCFTLSTELNAHTSNNQRDLDYQWFLNGSMLENNNSAYLHIEEAGLYSLRVSDKQNGCITEENTKIEQIKGIEQVQIETEAPKCTNLTNGEIQISGIQGGSAPYIFSLNEQAFSQQSKFSDLASGEYFLQIEDANGCRWEEMLHLEAAEAFEIVTSPSFSIFTGEAATLRVESNQTNVHFQWSDTTSLNCSTCQEVIAQPSESTLYEVIATNPEGCTLQTQVELRILNEAYYVPNAFTPMGTEENARFTIYGGDAIELIEQLTIYDRWGNLVFSKKNIAPGETAEGWDGTLNGKTLSSGIYQYKAVLKIKKGKKNQVMGEVLLLK